MRIHQLSIQAFGPFAGAEHIDFDELGAAGLFLLDGPTGAGKSSILDAICYAIYGSLPGNRTGNRQIRSDHAADGLAPQVRCELSIGTRRFEVTRSPAWMRPSKRGKNRVTEEKAASSLREYVDGRWEALSTRNDEVGQLIGTVLGLDREQFTKVVMLPQGGFADFLRAKDTEREKLLARLFDTSDYAKIEEEFTARLQRERKHTEAIEAELAALENQVRSDASGSLRAAGTVLPAAGEPDLDFEQLERLLGQLEQERTQAAAARRKEFTAAAASHSRLEEQRRIFTRLAELRHLEAEHAARADQSADAAAALALDSKASQVRAYRRQAEDAAQGERLARARLDEAAGQLSAQLPGRALEYTAEALERLAADVSESAERLGVLRSALPSEKQRSTLSAELGKQRRLAAEEQSKAAAAQARVEQLAADRVRLEALDLDEVSAATAVQLAERALEAATAQAASVAQRDDLAAKATKAQGLYNEQSAKLNDAQLELIAAQRRHLAQSAARLAAQLEPGEPCLVCGSTDHPQPTGAAENDELIDDELLEQLQDSLETQRQATGKREAQLHAAQARLDTAKEMVGELTSSQAQRALAAAEAQLKQATAEQAKTSKLAGDLATVRGQIESAGRDVTGAQLAAGVAAEKTASLGAQLEELEARLAELRGEHASLDARLEALTSRHTVITAAQQGLRQWLEAEAQLTQADQRWKQERTAAGFTDDEAYSEALLEPAARAELERLQAAHQRRAAAIETLAASDDVQQARRLEADGTQGPDANALAESAEALAATEERYEQSRREQVVASSALQRLREGRARLERRTEEAGPVIESFRRLKALADVVRGAGENRLKMTLGTYVLAARLEEVAAAATERLRVMSSQRYSLHHDDSSRGNAKSGLGLKVRDAWTGKDRETQTLSGGETFMASLALALGLADVISHHSGAVDMQTLFVDEGFGSLDAETLEQVMEALESLRSGGRVIGVVSHVSEMKQRIPNRLTVRKTRQGSAIEASADEALVPIG